MASKVEKVLMIVSPFVGLGAAWFVRGVKVKRLRKDIEESKRKQEQFEAFLDELEGTVSTLDSLNGRLNELNSGISSAVTENGEVDQEKLNEVLTELFKKYNIPDIDMELDTLDFN